MVQPQRRPKAKSKTETPSRSSRKGQNPPSNPSLKDISYNDNQVAGLSSRFDNYWSHTNPSKISPDNYLSTTYKSKYYHDFKHRGFDTPLKLEPKKYFNSPEKMDLKTINEEAYKAFAIKPQPPKTLFQTLPEFQHLAQSEYAQEFINWGGNYVAHEKRFHPPLRSTEIPFTANSTYRKNFNRGKGPRASYEGISAIQNNVNFGPRDLYAIESTYSSTMRNFNNYELNYRIREKANDYRGVSASPRHFATTTGDFFERKASNPEDFRSKRVSSNARS